MRFNVRVEIKVRRQQSPEFRELISTYEDPGWYEHPEGTVASIASKEDLKADLGIEVSHAEMKMPVMSRHSHNVNQKK